jgi:hypothetical protein
MKLFVLTIFFVFRISQAVNECPTINMVDASTSITFTEDCKLVDRITLNKDGYELFGNNHTLYAADNKGHFKIDGTSQMQIYFHDITFRNGTAYLNTQSEYQDGGSIYMVGASALQPGNNQPKGHFFNCHFINNKALHRGAAIYVEYSGLVNLVDTTFQDNYIMWTAPSADVGVNAVVEMYRMSTTLTNFFTRVTFGDSWICAQKSMDNCVTGKDISLDLLWGFEYPNRPTFAFLDTVVNTMYVSSLNSIAYGGYTKQWYLKQVNSEIKSLVEGDEIPGHYDKFTTCDYNGIQICDDLSYAEFPMCVRAEDCQYDYADSLCTPNPGNGIFCYEACNVSAGYGLTTPLNVEDHCRECTPFEHIDGNGCVLDTVYSCDVGYGLIATSNLVDDAECVACGAGEYSSGGEGATCKECGDGHTVFDNTMTVMNETGGEYCIPCSEAVEFDHDNKSTTACVSITGRCHRGWELYSTSLWEDNLYCAPCKYGYYKTESNSSSPCTPWTSQDNCSKGFYLPGTIFEDSECSFTQNENVVFHYYDPSDGTYELNEWCFPGQFPFVKIDGEVQCRTCSRTLFMSTFNLNTINSTDPSFRRGGCCINSHHRVCQKMMYRYKLACIQPEKGNATQCIN